jgi:hypothetical protein
MIDASWIGRTLPAREFTLERGRLQFFARAIGEDNPIYRSAAAARAAGYADIPAPPSFLFAAEQGDGDLLALLREMQVNVAEVLHAEQSFVFRRHPCAGETLTVHSRIADIQAKKNGALEFIVKESTLCDGAGQTVAELRNVMVWRHPAEKEVAA